jgi:two-component system OmpR family response regulator
VPTIQAATAAVRAWTPYLIVMELNLPDGDGLELLTRVHTAPATRHVLLMVVSQRRGVHDKIAAFQAGADDYLVKPVDLRDFEAHVLMVSKLRRILAP